MYFSNFLKKYIYLILIILTLIIISGFNKYLYFNIFSYIFIHIILIYLTFYRDSQINYIIIFLVGFTLDQILIGEYGPHLIGLMIFYTVIKSFKRFFFNFKLIYFIILQMIVAALLIIGEQYLALLLYNKQINLIILLNMNIFILLFYYPIFLILNRLNKYN